MLEVVKGAAMAYTQVALERNYLGMRLGLGTGFGMVAHGSCGCLDEQDRAGGKEGAVVRLVALLEGFHSPPTILHFSIPSTLFTHFSISSSIHLFLPPSLTHYLQPFFNPFLPSSPFSSPLSLFPLLPIPIPSLS